jgi:hypothetical protein
MIIIGNVMAPENALSYRVSQNGSAGDWYWGVISDQKIIERGLAPTKAQARGQALKVAASHAVRQPGESHATLRKSRAYRGTLKTTTHGKRNSYWRVVRQRRHRPPAGRHRGKSKSH